MKASEKRMKLKDRIRQENSESILTMIESIPASRWNAMLELSMECGFESAVMAAIRSKFAEFSKMVLENRARASKSAAENRKERELRREKWALENLKPGMVVKVESNAQTRYRLVREVGNNYFIGEHGRMVRDRSRIDLSSVDKPSRCPLVWQGGGYITSHKLHKIVAYMGENDKLISI